MLPVRFSDMPSFHLPNLLKGFSPFLDSFRAMFLCMLFKGLLIRTLLMPHISRVNEVENGEDEVTLVSLPALHHLSQFLKAPFAGSVPLG
ncbi:unnamed protein product [Linum tenue]|uniref:Uncharacterized protein n=1 Tax=Linum tenue TaxID=586396 RepID=A0AAV0RNF8_9ROSI|nr:unnamed protein product [Linum tenue]